MLGLAFKEGTDDCRESPAMEIINELLNFNADITAFDPQAMNNAKLLVGDKISYASDMYSAIVGADVIAVLTEWPEFKTLDLSQVSTLVNNKNIVDCRNMLNKDYAYELGFNYSCIGYNTNIAKNILLEVA